MCIVEGRVDKILMPTEIRFLRMVFELTQKEVAEGVCYADPSRYAKCEKDSTGVTMGEDKQVRLKVFYATKLGITNLEDYTKINTTKVSELTTSQDRPYRMDFFFSQEAIGKIKIFTEKLKSGEAAELKYG